MLTNFFAWFMVAVFNIYDGLCKYSETIRNIWTSRWANLTRPLRPTAEEAYLEQVAAFDRGVIARSNQDISHYDHKTWWAEYKQARVLNVN